jgi:transmembrane sensor
MNTQIYDEAGEWIVRHRTEELDVAARKRFDAWLRESPNHLRAYLELCTIWEELPALDPTWNLSADELIARARAESNIYPLGEMHSRAHADRSLHVTVSAARQSSLRRYVVVTAALLLVAVGVAGWLNQQRGLYTTDVGEQDTIVLLDGSTVQLNAHSKMRVHYTDQQRFVELIQGQALFKVAKDPTRPFVVQSDETRVRAVGTQFDVYRKSTATIVTVVEGRVAVHSPRVAESEGATAMATPRLENFRQAHVATLNALPGEVFLSAGEQLIAQDKSSAEPAVPSARAPTVPTPRKADVAAATAWTQQRLIFDYTPLNEVADEFNRYNQRRLVIEDAALYDFHISGSFSSTDPALLLRFLRAQPGIAVNESDADIRISQQQR